MKILSIETSCDETGVAIVEDGVRVVRQALASSLDLHALTGGVVPEVASRQQLALMLPTLVEVLHEVDREEIEAIAVTAGPGLIGSLLVGVETAKALSFAWGKPLIAVNHMLGHIYGAWLTHGGLMEERWPKLVLLVSGGHTELILMESHDRFYKVGQTLDDAAGEAFDKVAKLMGLPYPGGPSLSKLAVEGNRLAVDLPKPMAGKDNIDFSFSGLKTAVLHYVRQNPHYKAADLAASFEWTVVESLVSKTKRAAEMYGAAEVVLGGGVAANRVLRERLVERLSPLPVMIPDLPFTTDNGAVIGAAGFYQYKNGAGVTDWREVQADPSLELPEMGEI